MKSGSSLDQCVDYEFISHVFHENEDEVMTIAKLLHRAITQDGQKNLIESVNLFQ